MSVAWLTPDWPAPPRVRALSTWRGGGVSTGKYESLNLGTHVDDEGTAVAENRRRLAEAAHLPAEPCWLRQMHGTEVADLDSAVPAALGAQAHAENVVPPQGRAPEQPPILQRIRG